MTAFHPFAEVRLRVRDDGVDPWPAIAKFGWKVGERWKADAHGG